MKTPTNVLLRAGTVLVAALGCGQAYAQTAPASAPASNNTATSEEEPILLNQFTVSAEKVGRFSSAEATSGTRVATDLFSSAQSISVITREALEDTAATRVLDAAKYVSGISESTIPNGLDRTTIRGFQTDGQTIDGFQNGDQINLDPVFIDRIEVVKGPNAILAPAGVPGGTINNVSRKPELNNKESVVASWGLYDGERAEIDANQYITLKNDDKIAFRVVGAAVENNHGWRDSKNHFTGAMPMFMYQTKGGSQLTVQGIVYTGRSTNDLGIPIDPSSGTNNDATILSGLSRTTSTSGDEFRFERRQEMRAFFTTPVSDNLSVRIAGRYANSDSSFAQRLASYSAETVAKNADGTYTISGNSGGGYDPRTGIYTPGTVYYVDTTAGTVTPMTATAASRVVNTGNQYTKYYGNEYLDLQNDYAYKLDLSVVKLTTVAGWLYKYTHGAQANYNLTNGTLNYDNLSAWNKALNVTGIKTSASGDYDINIGTTQTQQGYFSENASFFDDKVVLAGSLAYDNFDITNRDRAATVPVQVQNADKPLKSYGIVIKPIEQVSAYYSYGEVASASATSNVATGSATVQSGKQNEFGVRYQGFNKKIYVTVAHFDIKQDNYSIPNPGNLVYPVPNPMLPALISNRVAKGWEFEFRAAVTKELSVIGNYTTFTNRDGNNIPFRGTAEHSGALLANYQFTKDSGLSGLSIGFGADYRGRTPGDSGGGALAFAIKQPSFYLGARTLFNLMVSYKINEHLKTQLTINNLFDKDYIESSVSRGAAYPGEGIDPNLRLTYSF